jgi:uncharacterized tellurite resistance protein B-like protein
MIDALKRLLQGPLSGGGSEPSDERAHDLKLATAALLFEVVRADGQITEPERVILRTAVGSTFDLPGPELDELLRAAEEASKKAISLYEFTQVVDTSLPLDDKKRVIELLWLVAFADSVKDALEEHTIRQIAGLLHVSHPDFIDAKIRARGRAATP